MPAWDDVRIGVKLVTVTPGNASSGLPLVQGIYVLFASATGEPLMLVDATPLTRLRTAAVSGVATRLLARADSSRLVVFGAGVQAEAHVEAMRAVRPIEAVTIVGRSRERAEALASRTRASVGLPQSVADADIVCTCTTSSSPLFDGAAVAAGTHVNAVGSYRPEVRELDDALVTRSRVVVDSETALIESGDLVIPLATGVLDEGDVTQLRDVGRTRVPRGGQEVTVFKSVGFAGEDLALASALFQRASG